MKKLMIPLLLLALVLTGCGAKEAININPSEASVCGVGGGCDVSDGYVQGVQVGNQIPNLTLTDKDDKETNLYDYIEGKKKVLMSLSVDWCSDCQRQNEKLQEYYKELPEDEDVLVIYTEFNAVSGAEEKTTNQEQMKKYVKEQNVDYPIFYDKGNHIIDTLGEIKATPKNYILDGNGIIKGITEEIDLDILLLPNTDNYNKVILEKETSDK